MAQKVRCCCELKRHGLQVVAVLYIALTIIIQLNIIATRNPSIFWWFSKKTAPPPSWKLAVPVALFLVAATFIAGPLFIPTIYLVNVTY